MEIGLFEAKAKLSQLLRLAQAGNRITITVRGKAVADLLPHQGASSDKVADAADTMLAFMRDHRETGRGFDLKSLIEEGRS
ncbi:type II toxin-antitoxin system Phd/YefM family antitoxin [Pelomicrobium sp.]|jgi:prevent-host-death family protein|uniref:type II toxin-antitoxin system Phd/YefM family antitoxin n=1 Tax=Pelomicrobium sp. TaxID=2815319 RepID=UPI002FDC98CC